MKKTLFLLVLLSHSLFKINAQHVEVYPTNWWTGMKLNNCAALPTGWDANPGRYGTVYLVSAALENLAPY